MNILVNLLIDLTKLLGGNLGVSLIFIGVVSRVVFYPMLKTSYKHMDIQRQLKPKLDAIKKKYAGDRQKLNEEQAKIMMESGFNPLAGCLAPLVQLVVAIFLFYALKGLISSGVQTQFLYWDLAKPDTWSHVFGASGFAGQLPGVLVIFYAISTLIQSKMMLPQAVPVEKGDSKKELGKKEDFADALANSQGQFVLLMPLLIMFTVRLLPAGLALYLFVNTAVGIVLQYFISGWGGLTPWLKIVKK